MIRRNQLLVLALTSLGSACHRGHPAWDPTAPLAPAIQFVEPVGARSLVVLVLDAHSGAPVTYARVMIAAAALAPLPDNLARTRFSNVPLGPQRLRVVAIGYTPWNGVISVSDSTGLAVVVQLRRSEAGPIEDFSPPAQALRIGEMVSPPRGLDSVATAKWVEAQRAACPGRLNLLFDEGAVSDGDTRVARYRAYLSAVQCNKQ